MKRLLAFGFGSLAALLLLSGALWWWAAPVLAKRAIDAALRSAGLPPVAYRIGALSWGTLQLDEISLGSGELAAQQVDVSFRLADLLARRVDAAAIRGLSLRAQRGERGWSLGTLDAWLREAAAARGSAGAPPLRHLVIEAASFALETPAGPAHGIVNADLVLTPQLVGSVTLDWQLPDGTPGSASAQIADTGAIRARGALALGRAFVAQWDPALAQRWPERLEVSLEGSGQHARSGIDFALTLDGSLSAGTPPRLRRARGPVELRWQQDGLLVTLPGCLALALPIGPLAPGVALERAGEVCVHTEAAPLRVTFDGATARLAEATVVATARDLAVKIGERARRVRGRDVALRVAIDARDPLARGALRLTGARFELPDARLALHKPVVDGRYQLGAAPSFSGRFEVAQVVDGAASPRYPPLRGTGDLELDARRVTFDARTRESTGTLAARITGEHAFVSGAGRAKLRFAPLVFDPHKSTLRTVERWLPHGLRIEHGTLGLDAQLRWSDKGLATAAELRSDGARVVASGNRVEGLTGVVALSEVFPPVTRGAQQVSFSRADAGIPFGAGKVGYAIEAGHVIRIEQAAMEFAGGQLEVRGSIDLDGGPAQRLEFTLRELQAPALLALAPVAGLEVSGTLSGALALAVEDGRPVLRGGAIRANEGGQIRYRPDGAAPAKATSATDVSGMLREVLRDFRYEALDVSATGWLDERADVQCQLRGYNPAFQNGRPVHLTINLSSAFAEVIHAMPAVDAFFAKLGRSPNDAGRERSSRSP